jgi:hypothetical protein
MNSYQVRNALNTGYGPSVPYAEAYEDSFELEAASDVEALAYVRAFQAHSDLFYRSLSPTSDDIANAPCYEANMYRDLDDYTMIAVDVWS